MVGVANLNTKHITAEQVEKANLLLNASVTRPEDNIRQDIGRLLDALEIDNLITYRTPEGPADLYLPRRRVFIETKIEGLADDPHKPQTRENPESAFLQLERYLLSELSFELTHTEENQRSENDWIGILTDGKVWHAWRYLNATGAIAQRCP